MTVSTAQTPPDDEPHSFARHPDLSALDNPTPGQCDSPVWRSVTIGRPRQELYRFWREFTNLPLFMHNIDSVMIEGARFSHWVIKAPAGETVEWDSEITRDEPGRLIAWRSLEGSIIRNSGQVEFLDSPESRGTVVRVTLAYDPPGGAVGQLIARLCHKEPKIQARQDLRRFKQLMECGEVSTAQSPDAAPSVSQRPASGTEA